MSVLLKEKIQLWSERFEALSLRERLLFLGVILAVMYIGWDMVLMDRVRSQQKTVAIQVKKWRSQIADIDQRIQAVSASLNGSTQQQAIQRIESLKSEISEINQRQKALAVSFIRPRQMVDVLKGLLATEKGLQLTRLQSQAVQSLIGRAPEPRLPAHSQPHSQKKQQSTAPPKSQPKRQSEVPSQQGGTAALPEVYKHGLEIVFQGDYNSTLSYLRKLEQLPWKFYWEEVAYEVLDYPKAQILVRIHTLSLDRRWISV
jgi:MSHA biogenesis protein MshJ